MKIVNAVAVTLLIALVSVIPAALIGKHLPALFDPGLRPVAVSAWISGLIAWYVSRHATLSQKEASEEAARQHSGSSGVAITMAFLALACGVVAALHFFGGGLI